MMQRMIATYFLMRVFAVNPNSAMMVANIVAVLHFSAYVGAVVLVALLLGDAFGPMWLLSTLVLHSVGKKVYQNVFGHYSPEHVKKTARFLQSLIHQKPKGKKQ